MTISKWDSSLSFRAIALKTVLMHFLMVPEELCTSGSSWSEIRPCAQKLEDSIATTLEWSQPTGHNDPILPSFLWGPLKKVLYLFQLIFQRTPLGPPASHVQFLSCPYFLLGLQRSEASPGFHDFLCLSSLHHNGKPIHFKEKGPIFSIGHRGLKQALPPTKMSMILNTEPCSLLEHRTCPDCDKPFLFFSDHRGIFHIQHCGSHNFPLHLLLTLTFKCHLKPFIVP